MTQSDSGNLKRISRVAHTDTSQYKQRTFSIDSFQSITEDFVHWQLHPSITEDVVHLLPLLSVTERTLSIGSLFRPSQRGRYLFAATPLHHREDVVHWLSLLSITERTLSIGCHSCPSQRLADLFCQPLSESDSTTGGNPASCSFGL